MPNKQMNFGTDILPATDSTYNLGSSSKRFNDIQTDKINGAAVPENPVFTDTTYSNMTGAGASAEGASGLVPAPAAGDNEKFLRGDGTWETVPKSVYFVKGPDTDTTGVWTGTLDGLTAYYEGLTIIYVPAVGGVAGGTTLNINNLGAKGCYSNESTVTSQTFQATSPIMFTYNDNRWERADKDTINIYNLVLTGSWWKTEQAIGGYTMLFQTEGNNVTPITSDSSTGTSKTMLTSVEFDPFGMIMFWYATATASASTELNGQAIYYALSSLDLRYFLNCGTSAFTEDKPVYLVVTPTSGRKCTIASSTPWAQTLPNSDDGNWYIHLGNIRHGSTYQMMLIPKHSVYRHNGTGIVRVFGNDAYISGKADKVASATSGDVATLDSNGNLVDSGKTLGVSVPVSAVFTDTTYSAFTGAGASTAGTAGLVPAPSAGDQNKVLSGAGTWVNQSGGSAPTTLSLTAAAGSWTSATPPTQTLSATGVTASNTIIVGLADSATSVQLEAAQAGNIRCTAQSAGEITLTCYGTEPTENIPVSVVILG